MADTCRDAVLEAFKRLLARTNRREFQLSEIVAEVQRSTGQFSESTIRTHIVSRMCANAPDNHAVVHDDLQRVSRGVYRLREASR